MHRFYTKLGTLRDHRAGVEPEGILADWKKYMEKLEKEQFSADLWVRIGLAAKKWRIYGVALRALERGNGTVRHLVRDIYEVEHRLSLDRSLLRILEQDPKD